MTNTAQNPVSHSNLNLWRAEFPDFDASTMPQIPAGWRDASSRNDVCPRFDAGDFSVFINYASPVDREIEFSTGGRFMVCVGDNYDEALITDDWSAVLALVK